MHTLVVTGNGTQFTVGTSLVSDADNATTRTAVCSTLSDEDDCKRWRLCCDAARACCAKQITMAGNADVGNSTCKKTWDGFGCWDPGEPGTNSYLPCPTFLKFSVPTSKSNAFIATTLSRNL